MPVPLIFCRLKDDHSVTQMIGETALFHFPQWEPVPEEPEEELVPDKPVARAKTRAAASAEKDKE